MWRGCGGHVSQACACSWSGTGVDCVYKTAVMHCNACQYRICKDTLQIV